MLSGLSSVGGALVAKRTLLYSGFLSVKQPCLFGISDVCTRLPCWFFIQRKTYLRGSSSEAWLDRQRSDRYIEQAKQCNYRARSAFKLIELDNKYRILKPNQLVLDLGASPGSWSQVAAQRVIASRDIATQISIALAEDKFSELASQGTIRLSSQSGGLVIGVDLLDIRSVPGCVFLSESDFTDAAVHAKLVSIINAVSNHDGPFVDVVLSDMAPNASGMNDADHINILKLALAAYNFAEKYLAPNGAFVCKLWSGEYNDRLYTLLKTKFQQVVRAKPDASRIESSELFFVATRFNRVAEKSRI